MEINLEATRITALPEDAYYISDFITEDGENWLLQKVRDDDFLMSKYDLKPRTLYGVRNTGVSMSKCETTVYMYHVKYLQT